MYLFFRELWIPSWFIVRSSFPLQLRPLGRTRRVEGLGLVFFVAVFALLEDALAYGALGKTSIAAAPSVPSRNTGSSSNSFFIIELLHGLT